MENKNKVSFGAKLKEAFRKFLVSLKRNPHIIPLLVLFVAYIVYTFNITHISKTTAAINIMIGLSVGMSVLVLVSNILYQNCITVGVEKYPTHLTGKYAPNILAARSVLKWHLGFVIAGLVLLALLPVYSKLLKKINTSIEIEYSEDVGEIELSSEE